MRSRSVSGRWRRSLLGKKEPSVRWCLAIGLIHEIGGEDDNNRNTTRRLLLLLESRAIGREDAYKRVVRSILERYLLEDRGFWRGTQYRVPRFLQNDFARYWRTLAVDFAYKLRNVPARAGRFAISSCECHGR